MIERGNLSMTFIRIKRTLRMLRLLALTMILALGLLLPASATTYKAEVPFNDVHDSDWFFPAVHYVYSNRIMNGTSETLFNPQGTVTRAMAVTVLYRMSGQTLDCLINYFPDVDYHEYYASAVCWAYEGEILKGFEDGTFRPDDPVTREQMAAILCRYLQKVLAERWLDLEVMIDEETHPDWDQVSNWARESMVWIIGTGMMRGSGAEQFLLPQDAISRAELAQMLTRSRDFLDEELGGQGQSVPFPMKADATSRSFDDRIIEQMPAEQNWAVSPYSLKQCLAMLTNGADGTTRQELLKALQINDLDQYNQEVKALLERYDSYQGFMSLETGNSLWINQDRFEGKGQFLPDFTDLLKTSYRAETREVRDENSVEEMNQCASEKTHGRINEIADESHRHHPAALMNAVYFKAAWVHSFISDMTKPQTFHNADGSESQMSFMHQTEYFGYFAADGIRAVRMPYKIETVDNSSETNHQYFPVADFSMYLLLSEQEPDLQYILEHANFELQEVNLAVPKFRMEYGTDFNELLKTMGVSAVFDPSRADLSRMMDAEGLPLYLDSISQKAWIAIDEKGTEAAAVTIAPPASGPPLEIRRIIEFTADRPFYFVIRDDQNGHILFAGKFNQADGR